MRHGTNVNTLHRRRRDDSSEGEWSEDDSEDDY